MSSDRAGIADRGFGWGRKLRQTLKADNGSTPGPTPFSSMNPRLADWISVTHLRAAFASVIFQHLWSVIGPSLTFIWVHSAIWWRGRSRPARLEKWPSIARSLRLAL